MAWKKISVKFEFQQDLVKMLEHGVKNADWVISRKLFNAF